jgi:hypothetical protein
MSQYAYGKSGSRSPDRSTADSLRKALRCLREGTLSIADFAFVCALEGLVFTGSLGSSTTPVTFKTGFTAAQPELAIDVPALKVVIPLSLQVHLETSAGTINEIVAQTSQGTLIGAGTSTVVTPRPNVTDAPVATGVSVYGAYSASGTAPTTPNEFWRTGYAFADTTVGPLKVFNWNPRDFAPVVIVGVGALAVYVGGTSTAPSGYIKASWIELPSSLVA